MKVNILGRGIIPTLKEVAPLMNVDLDIHTVNFLLGSPNLGIYRVSDLKKITGANIKQLFAEEEVKATEEPAVEEAPVVEEIAPVVEAVEEPTTSWDGITDYHGLVTDETVEEPTEEAPVEEVVDEAPAVEETVEEERPVSKKKNKKNRNNG